MPKFALIASTINLSWSSIPSRSSYILSLGVFLSFEQYICILFPEFLVLWWPMCEFGKQTSSVFSILLKLSHLQSMQDWITNWCYLLEISFASDPPILL